PTPPTNSNLIHLRGIQGAWISNIFVSGWDSAGDSAIDIEGGTGSSFSETNIIDHLYTEQTANMLTLDGDNTVNGSLNNNTLINAHCDTSYNIAGTCLNLK